jgi:RimK family alpha-L-glutamate ligase
MTRSPRPEHDPGVNGERPGSPPTRPATSRAFIVGTSKNDTNVRLRNAWADAGYDVELIAGDVARCRMRPGDVAIGRLDVLPSLDGVEPGLFELLLLERAGFEVLNRARALLACHDKWRTARLLGTSGLPHPQTAVYVPGSPVTLSAPLVVKPRFGSWGVDVERCETQQEVEACLERVSTRSWFRRHGALLQELVPSDGTDLRIIVAGGHAVGATQRIARHGEWRTNTSLGGTRRSVDPPGDARAIAVEAARAVDADFAGVDLLPLAGGGYTVLELNAAVDFTPDYGIGGNDPYEAAALALGLRRAPQEVGLAHRSLSAGQVGGVFGA